ncbi:MAG TPA: YqiA/YcfP family alpha/beta fold hydrolase [Candidatus Caenarcaniphilales bacterium]
MTYFYLHGFASSPRSAKAVYLSDRFEALGLNLQVPNLNQEDFFNLTLTRQIHQVQAAFPPPPDPVTLIGSSLGGLVAAWVAQQQTQVQRLILLAPAFEFLSRWLPKLGQSQVQSWQSQGQLAVYHYGEQRSLQLSYQFVLDAQQYPDNQLQRPVPTLIMHGLQDDVIPVQVSHEFAAQRPWVRLMELESDHSLSNVTGKLWDAIQEFCQLGQ